MRIFYLLKENEAGTLENIMDEHRSGHEVEAVDLRREKDYEKIVDLIVGSDRVISW